jgi:hypothetical protein
MITFKKLSLKTRVILVLQSLALIMGTSTHLSWVIQNGFLSEKYNAPLPTMLFWDGLTLLDPLAALLLFIKPKIGLVLTLIIILADVLHNNIFYFDELYLHKLPIFDWIEKYWMILGQLVFALFALLTFRGCLREINATQ